MELCWGTSHQVEAQQHLFHSKFVGPGLSIVWTVYGQDARSLAAQGCGYSCEGRAPPHMRASQTTDVAAHEEKITSMWHTQMTSHVPTSLVYIQIWSESKLLQRCRWHTKTVSSPTTSLSVKEMCDTAYLYPNWWTTNLHPDRKCRGSELMVGLLFSINNSYITQRSKMYVLWKCNFYYHFEH